MQRVYVRVDMNGKEPVRELMIEGEKQAEMSYLETVDMISDLTDLLRAGPVPVHLAISATNCVEMSFVEALDFIMQAGSSLRYEKGL